MEKMNIKNARYFSDNGSNVSINTTIDGVEMSVPLDPANRHYAAIMEQVDTGTLTIAEADNVQ